MKRVILGGIFLLLAIGLAFSQEVVSLDEAIKKGIFDIESRLNPGVKVVILNFNAQSPRFSNYVMDEMMTMLVMNGKITVVDRLNLELIQQEMSFQMSGEVSDSSAQAIGQKLGAQSIISGSIDDMGGFYRIRFRTIEVETAKIQALTSVNITKDNQVAMLMGNSKQRNANPRVTGRTNQVGSFNHWISLEASLIGFGARYEGMLNPKISLGLNGYINSFFVQWTDYAVDASLRYYPQSGVFFLGIGIGFHLKDSIYDYYYDPTYGEVAKSNSIIGAAITPEVGWRFRLGQSRFFIQPGVKIPLIFGDGTVWENNWRTHSQGDPNYLEKEEYYSFAFSAVPYVGIGIAF